LRQHEKKGSSAGKNKNKDNQENQRNKPTGGGSRENEEEEGESRPPDFKPKPLYWEKTETGKISNKKSGGVERTKVTKRIKAKKT